MDLFKAQRKKSNYVVKKNLFNNITFAIIESSFLKYETEDFVEGMRRQIIENGGIVVQSDAKANYVVYEDGHNPDVWGPNDSPQCDSLERYIVHFRWVHECIRKG